MYKAWKLYYERKDAIKKRKKNMRFKGKLYLTCPGCYFRLEGYGKKICKKCFLSGIRPYS